MACSLCGYDVLRDHGSRTAAYCENCHGLERHRALARVFAADIERGDGRSALEVGPASEFVFGGYLTRRGWRYLSIDQSPTGHPNDPRRVDFIDAAVDATNLAAFSDGTFDLIIVQHVIEEIVDYGRALDELSRVLSENGVALLEIPHDPDRAVSEQHPPNRFGNVWRFGADLQDRLRERFGEVERCAFQENDYRGAIFRCRAPRVGRRRAAAPEPEARPASRDRERPVRSFWQSPVVMAEINRRITGDRATDPIEHFRARHVTTERQRGLSLTRGGGQLERRLVDSGVCRQMLGVDVSPDRVGRANDAVPPALAGRLSFEAHDLAEWDPPERFDLIVAQDVLHRLGSPDTSIRRIAGLLAPDGLLYVHAFIGPARFQWTDRQLEIINRLLDQLPDRLRVDLVDGDGRLRAPVGRPDPARMIAEDPSEAIDPPSIPRLLEELLEPVEVRRYGGAVFHQLFNRIMGNFSGDPDIVRILMEVDFLLTDLGVVDSDYLWGVYRPRSRRRFGLRGR